MLRKQNVMYCSNAKKFDAFETRKAFDKNTLKFLRNNLLCKNYRTDFCFRTFFLIFTNGTQTSRSSRHFSASSLYSSQLFLTFSLSKSFSTIMREFVVRLSSSSSPSSSSPVVIVVVRHRSSTLRRTIVIIDHRHRGQLSE